MSRMLSRFSPLSARMGMVQSSFGILRTWRTLEVAILTVIIYLPDALSLWLLVKAVGRGLGFADLLTLLGPASLNTLVPSGSAFLGTLQFVYALAIQFADGPRAMGIAAATLAQLFLFLPVALIATGLLTHGSGKLLLSLLKGRSLDAQAAGPHAGKIPGP